MYINSSEIFYNDMPKGLDFAFAQNQAARDYFNRLPKDIKMRVIQHTHMVQSMDEMQAFADSLMLTCTV